MKQQSPLQKILAGETRLTQPPLQEGDPQVLGVGILPDDLPTPDAPPVNPYSRIIQGVEVDIYRILKAFGVTDPAVQHAIKKLLRQGRAGKSEMQDITEAIQSLQRAVEIMEEDA